MRSRFMEATTSLEGFLNGSSYTLYVAFMAILFALVSFRHNIYSKRLKFAVGLFVVNFVAALLALQHTIPRSLTFRSVFYITMYITMILAPGLLLHVLVLPPSANNDDIHEPQGEGILASSAKNGDSDPKAIMKSRTIWHLKQLGLGIFMLTSVKPSRN